MWKLNVILFLDCIEYVWDPFPVGMLHCVSYFHLIQTVSFGEKIKIKNLDETSKPYYQLLSMVVAILCFSLYYMSV